MDYELIIYICRGYWYAKDCKGPSEWFGTPTAWLGLKLGGCRHICQCWTAMLCYYLHKNIITTTIMITALTTFHRHLYPAALTFTLSEPMMLHSVFARIEIWSQTRYRWVRPPFTSGWLLHGFARTDYRLGCLACYRHGPHIRWKGIFWYRPVQVGCVTRNRYDVHVLGRQQVQAESMRRGMGPFKCNENTYVLRLSRGHIENNMWCVLHWRYFYCNESTKLSYTPHGLLSLSVKQPIDPFKPYTLLVVFINF